MLMWRCREEHVHADLLAKYVLQLRPRLRLLTRNEAFDFFTSLGISFFFFSSFPIISRDSDELPPNITIIRSEV